jgi:penicillin-binding protein 1A
MSRTVSTTRSTRRASRGGRAGRPSSGGKSNAGRGRLWRWRRPLFLLGLLFVLAVAGVAYLFTQVPLPTAEPPLLQTTFICGGEVTTGCTVDNSLAQLSGSEDRVTVTYDQLPPVLINAVVAAEDRDFFEHQGVDPFGIARALWANVRNESVQQGGSTITQQYVKNVYLTQERTLTRKVKEAALAVKVERELSKQEILTRYLNVIYFGRGAYGVQAASRSYFGKNVDQLTLPEAAYLAGLIRAPETADAQLLFFDPKQPEQRATAQQRRRSVLDGMLVEGYITQAEYDGAVDASWDSVLARPLTANNFGTVAFPELGTEYYLDYVKHWLVTSGEFTDAEIYGGGLRIYTTLDLDMQRAAIDAVSSTLNRPDDPAAALVALDGQGRVKAMVGGLDYQKSRVNLAVGSEGGGSGRQPGSSFKPIILAEALKQGTPLDKVYDAPAKKVFPDANAGDDWEVGNYADAGLGKLNLIDSTRKSSNTAYAQMILDVGVDNAAALAKRMGISAEVPDYPSIVLGTSSVSVLDMASAYSTFADNGEHVDPVVVARVTDAKGTVLYEAPNERERVLSEDVAQGVNWTLNQVVENGTGTGAKFGQPAAGKTGTTDEYRDAWFVGYTCSLTSAVWMGYPGAPDTAPRYMNSVHGVQVTGGTFPATIWRKFMTEATKDLPSCPFEKPARAPATTDTFVPGTTPRPSGTTVPPSSTTVPPLNFPPSSPAPTQPPPSSSTTAPPPSSSTTAPP